MREKRGAIGRTIGAVASVASSARARVPKGEVRVVVHDEHGHSRLLDPSSPHHERIADSAQALLELVAEGRSAT